jgi:phosphoribosylaminoimidazole-succinocarboxamide synthase
VLATDWFLRSGKVRDLFELPDGRMVLVASDRISAFDVVLPTPVPDKGRILTALSRFWFAETAGIIPNHLLATDPAVLRDAFAVGTDVGASGAGPLPPATFDDWRGRLMVCRKAEVVPVEAVVRGYLAGSAWLEYQATGSVCGVPLPAGLQESERLPEPIFTPATKAAEGEHDQNIDFDAMIEHIGADPGWGPSSAGEIAERIRTTSIALYGYAAAIAARTGILVADTKFEFGLIGEDLVLIDEALTPDSSRFWDAATYRPGGPQASFDKQFVRDYLSTLEWDRTAPGPPLPDEVVVGTRSRYIEAFERITGANFERYLQEDVIAR